MIAFLLWFLTISLLGWMTFPLAFRLLPGLPSRGYAFGRALGLLCWGYVFWLLASLQVLPNNSGGLLSALLIFGGLCYWAWRGIDRAVWRAWWAENRRTVLAVELLFLASFALWAVVRAAAPAINGTEKPMELAFINAILHSPTFPPHDPWLSGYAISYYYFGYVLVSMLAMLTGTPAGVAFNLGLALTFALSAAGMYGLAADLLGKRKDNPRPLWAGLLAPLFLLLTGNLEGLLEVIHRQGWFWRSMPDGSMTSRFWVWLDMKELSLPPSLPLGGGPSRHWWWWRASRVVQDYDLAGNFREVIDEFPAFSYLLGDLHPHVLAVPFGLLVVALALNLFWNGGQGKVNWLGWEFPLSGKFFALSALALGGLAFLNTWDFPIYVGLFAGVYVLWQAGREDWGWSRLGNFVRLGLALGVSGVALYLPFYFGFSSQAGGFLPNLINPTRGAHIWVMFGTLWLPLLAYLLYRVRSRKVPAAGLALRLTAGLMAGLWGVSLLMGWGISKLPVLGELFTGSLGASDGLAVLSEGIMRRVTTPGGWLLMGGMLFLALWAFWPQSDLQQQGQTEPDASLFVGLLTVFSLLLVILPEFFYLRDQFGTRMNTIFKFYYQAWILGSLAAGYGGAVLLSKLKGIGSRVFAVFLALILSVGMVYPVLGVLSRTSGFHPPAGWTLDGTRDSGYLTPDDRAAVEWLSAQPQGVLAEAVGGSYSQFARISTHSGQPAVLGWPGHEGQWRGGYDQVGSREGDMATLYTATDWPRAADIIRKYHIRYIYIGPLERSTYRVSEFKLQNNLEVVFQQGLVTIYRTSE